MFEIDEEFLEEHDPRFRPVATRLAVGVARFMLWVGRRTRRRVEGRGLPDQPVIFATNHTHVLDFIPFWIELLGAGERLIGWVKARMYHDFRRRMLMRWLGNNLPLVSRGYLIASDFRRLLGRPPTDEEYRHLRDHVDEDEPVPDHSPFDRVCWMSREMLGRRYDPSEDEYGRAMRQRFYRMMQTTLEITGRCIDDGYHLHIYPEGEVSRHLTEGHTGIIQAAIALDLPVVPVGISGADQAFVGNGPLTRGGEVRLRFGEPMYVDPDTVGDDFRPFHPRDQLDNEENLQREVDRVMQRLDGLVDEGYGLAASGDGRKEGVARFY